MAEEPWDELMGPSRKDHKSLLGDEDPTMTASVPLHSTPSRWAQYESDSAQFKEDTHEATCKAVELAAEKIANSPPRLGAGGGAGISLPTDYESDDGSQEYGWENDEAIRAEALKMLEIADDHLSTPYSVRKTESGGFSASYSGGIGSRRSSLGDSNSTAGSNGKRVPKALAGLDFTKRAQRASYTTSPRSSYNDEAPGGRVEEANLVDVMGMDNGAEKKESKWSSRYSIDHTLLSLSSGRSARETVNDVLNRMDRETDRESKSANNMGFSSPHESSGKGIFGSGGFSFRDTQVFGKQAVTSTNASDTNLKSWRDVEGLDRNGNSLTAPEPRKTWQEQVERKKRQQRLWSAGAVGICVILAIIIGLTVSSKSGGEGSNSQASAFGSDEDRTRGTPEVVFYVTSDSPYDSSEEQKLAADMAALPSDAEFIVHLGNIQNSAVTLCSESRYSRVKNVLMESPVPMFILPGEEDWNNCPNPDNAWESWQDNFKNFESNFEHNFQVSRQLRRKENFAFLHGDIMFMGFHLVGGRINNQDDWDSRLDDNINWMETMITMNQGGFKSIVMLGNARPGPQQRNFFDRLAAFLGPYDLPIIYIHANSGVGGVMQYELFGGGEGIEGLQIEDGGQNPPLRISVYAGDSPFVVG